MKLGVYSVYDRKALAYATPFFAPNDLVAARMFSGAVVEGTELYKYPEDFVCYRIGDYDDSIGSMDTNDGGPTTVVTASEVVRRMVGGPEEGEDDDG